jgi:two-component system sensor histidine kinase/response regulator
VPLHIQGQLIGTLHLEADRPRAFTAERINAAIETAVLLAVGIRQARLYEQAQREIAERKQAQAALHQRTLELEERNAELDAFAHTVAHDLKNPLSTIMGYTSLLVDFIEEQDASTSSPEDLLSIANQVIQGSEIMDDIIESLLLLAGVRKQKVQFEPLDMASILVEVQHSLNSMVKEYKAEMVLPDRWPRVLGYEPWARAVWVNYVSNAIKYGGRPPRVELGYSIPKSGMRNSKEISFWVKDNGPGLVPEEQARLFIPFERLGQVQVEGHGLGLSIVRRIVEKLGGQAGSESTPGQGSVFWFTLPAVKRSR